MRDSHIKHSALSQDTLNTATTRGRRNLRDCVNILSGNEERMLCGDDHRDDTPEYSSCASAWVLSRNDASWPPSDWRSMARSFCATQDCNLALVFI